jgi:dTDP-4-amino-4,6-dideoxygalactose transaminase
MSLIFIGLIAGVHNWGKKTASGSPGCFSFYPSKYMAISEEGIINGNEDDIALLVRLTIYHGQLENYQHMQVRYNLLPSDSSAATGRGQFRKMIMIHSSNLSLSTSELEEDINTIILCE